MYIFALRDIWFFAMSYYPTKKKSARWFEYPVAKLVFRLLVVLLLFSISRWLIYLFNTEFFHHLSLREAFRLFFQGMRFDLVVIAYANIPMILLYCLPAKFIYNQVLQKIVNILFVFVNSVLVMLNMVDVIYFRFIGKRMTSELLQFFSNSFKNIASVFGHVLTNYWYLLVLVLLFVLVLAVVGKRTKLVQQTEVITNRWYFIQWISFMVFSVLTPLACRGGIQAKPIDQTTALRYADSQNVPIVLNTPFSIVKSTAGQVLPEVHRFDPEEMDFSPIHYSLKPNRFVLDSLDYAPNLMYIVLDGIGQEMISYYNPESRFQLTPFLDSLLTQSLTFNGRANGRRSVEALPALLSGVPSLMDLGFTSSPYSDKKMDALDLTLEQHGYHDSRLPFAIMVYTLSSSNNDKDSDLPKESYLWSHFEKKVYHTDCALRDIFEEASRQSWFDSTLFVITANHSNTEHYQKDYSNIWGMYSIPIAFFMPSRIPAYRCEEIAQQIDLNVSILSALGVEDTVFSFGRNVFDSLSEPNFIAYINQTYQFSDGQYLVQSDGENTIGVFNVIRDRQLDDNLIDRIQCADLSRKLKERIQEFNNRFIFNELYINKEALHEQAKDTVYHQSDIWQETPEESGESN